MKVDQDKYKFSFIRVGIIPNKPTNQYVASSTDLAAMNLAPYGCENTTFK